MSFPEVIMHRFQVRFLGATLMCAALSVSCGRDESSTAEDTTASAEETAAASTESAPAPMAQETSAEAPLTVADIDRWQRGMEGELKAVREAGAQRKAAKSSADTLAAMMAANETSTREAGARAAGVNENRYGLIQSKLSSVVRFMVPLEQEMDASKMPASVVTQMKEERAKMLTSMSSGLSPAVIEALRPRAVALRKQELALTGERLKAAGMAR